MLLQDLLGLELRGTLGTPAPRTRMLRKHVERLSARRHEPVEVGTEQEVTLPITTPRPAFSDLDEIDLALAVEAYRETA